MEREKSCGTIVFLKENSIPKFLLLHYAGGHWDFPKGHVEKGETEEATALRELEEETGISRVRIVPGFQEKITYYYKRKKETIFKQVRFFLVESKQTVVKLSLEHQEFKWLSFKEAIELLTYSNAKKILKNATDFLGQKTILSTSEQQ